MQAYHGKQEIKDKYVARMQAHIEADELVRGIGFEKGKGCAVGCTLNNYAHADYETELGIPEWLARLEDRLFEGMNLEKSKTFPLIFLQTIRPGIDLDSIKKPFMIYILEEALTSFDNAKYPAVTKVIHQVITLQKTVFESEAAAEEARASVEEAARAAAWAAAEAAEEAEEAWVAAEEAWAAAEAAAAAEKVVAKKAVAETVVRAAWAAAWTAGAAGAAAWAAARAVAYDKYADKLLELISKGGEECLQKK